MGKKRRRRKDEEKDEGRGEARKGGGEEKEEEERREKLSLYTSLAWVRTCELCMSASFQFAFELGHPYKLLIFSPNLIFLKFSVFEKIIAQAKHISHHS